MCIRDSLKDQALDTVIEYGQPTTMNAYNCRCLYGCRQLSKCRKRCGRGDENLTKVDLVVEECRRHECVKSIGFGKMRKLATKHFHIMLFNHEFGHL